MRNAKSLAMTRAGKQVAVPLQLANLLAGHFGLVVATELRR